MFSNWRYYGLWLSLVLELALVVLFVSDHLVKLGQIFAEILWLSSGFSGVAFGVINMIWPQGRKTEILSVITTFLGFCVLALWLLTSWIASM